VPPGARAPTTETTEAKAGPPGAKGTTAETAEAKPAPGVKGVGKPKGPAAEAKTAAPPGEEAAEKPAPMHPTSPHADPGFQAVVGRVQHAAAKLKTHAPAHAKAAAAQKAAAVSPAAEAHSRAAAGQVDSMDQGKPKPFDRAAFVAAVKAEVEKHTPQTLGDVDEFKKRGTAGEIKPAVSGHVEASKQEAQGDIPGRVAQEPDASGVQPEPSTPLPPEPATPPPADVQAADAVPRSRPDAEVSLEAGSASLDRQMSDAKVTDDQLRKSNEPAFQGSLKAKNDAKAYANSAPAAFRQGEQATLAQAKADAQGTAQAQMTGLAAAHGKASGDVAAHQTAAKAQTEKERNEVIAKLESIYQATKADVEARLKKLDDDVNQAFDQGAEAAQKAFEDEVDTNITQFKIIRYGASLGVLWLKDVLLGPPPEVEQFYKQARDNYLRAMDGVLGNVAGIVDTGLGEAKARIAAGKAEIQEYLKGLPKALQAFGQDAARNIQAKFDQLEQSVEAKQGQLVDGLAQKYSEKLQQVDAKIAAMREADRGLVSKAAESIAGTIQTILGLKAMLTTVLSKAAEAVDLIVADPIGFLGNLLSAVKQGFMNFVGKIGTYLQEGLLGWLFGALEGAGIKVPPSLDLKSIFNLILQVLGITYANIRARAVKIVGEKVVVALETTVEIFKILVTEGAIGLWNWIKEKVTSLKDMVINGIKQFVMQKVIMAGVNWVLSLLSPASAFIKACIAIYDTVMFLIERAKQILTLANAVVDSVLAIAKGSLGAAAAFVENALARAVPLVITFLADLLGLGGISDTIKSWVEKGREYVNMAIDWVINKAVSLVKAVGSMLFGKEEKKEEKPDERSQEEKERDVKQAVADGRALAKTSEITKQEIEEKLPAIREEYRLTTLALVETGEGKFKIHGEINPEDDSPEFEVDDLAGSPGEFTEESLWDEVIDAAAKSPNELGKTVVRIDPGDETFNAQVCETYIDKSTASVAQKAAAKASVARYLTMAAAATTVEAIENNVRAATAAVNSLYDEVQLHYHHGQGGVAKNPLTYARTRGNRIRARIAQRIAGKVKNLRPEEIEIAKEKDTTKRRSLIRDRAQQQLETEQEGTDKPELETIEARILPAQAHIGKGGVHSFDDTE
jgi:hypothetical protein